MHGAITHDSAHSATFFGSCKMPNSSILPRGKASAGAKAAATRAAPLVLPSPPPQSTRRGSARNLERTWDGTLADRLTRTSTLAPPRRTVRPRGQHLTVPISTNDRHCWKPARRWQRRARSTPTPPPVPPPRPPCHVPRTRQLDGGKTDVLSSANGPSTASLQQRCHRTSTLARSPSWPPMPGPCPQRAAAVRPERIQPRIRNRIFIQLLHSSSNFCPELCAN